jgi:hypothetical protein
VSGGRGEPPADSLRYLFYVGLFLALLFVLGVLVRA